MTYYKILTHDYRSPIQGGGSPIWDGVTLPLALPTVELDTSSAQCASGWHYVRNLSVGFTIAGLWRSGKPSVVVVVEPSSDAIERDGKLRCSQLTIVRRATESEIEDGIRELSAQFGAHAPTMMREQLAWRDALSRPLYDEDKIEESLRVALSVRGLEWELKHFQTVAATRDVRAAQDAWASWAAWGAARDVRTAWDAWDAWAMRDIRDAWAVRAAWDVVDTRDARDALMWFYTTLSGRLSGRPEKYTDGIREAYRHGLMLLLPTAKNELGWV